AVLSLDGETRFIGVGILPIPRMRSRFLERGNSVIRYDIVRDRPRRAWRDARSGLLHEAVAPRGSLNPADVPLIDAEILFRQSGSPQSARLQARYGGAGMSVARRHRWWQEFR